MPTPPDPQPPRPGRIVEPVRVVRARRQDALAELMRELLPEDGQGRRESAGTPPPGRPGTPPPPPPPAGAEDETQELPPVPEHPEPSGAPSPRAGHRRSVAVLALGAAALVGFGCALLLPARQNATAAGPAHSAASRPVTITPATTGPATPAAPSPDAPAASATADPDGPGTLREGDSGPGVTELRERLLRIPDVFRDGSATGGYDAVLAAAVARFQVWYGVSGDERGVYGDDTRRALESRT
ncbi:peptidoglycan-binding protein [Streptomyces sp. NPDC005435]|uniref:peptidoglycan-binding protein n=1 Tax=Streptomyces sp. NPDC005435 TaxID=3154464 RepID=UPI003456BD7C